MKILSVCVLFLVVGASLRAQSAQSSESPKLDSWSVDLTFASKFVYRGQQLATSTIHPSVEYAAESIYAGYWADLPTAQRSLYEDHNIFYTGAVKPISEKALLDFGAMQYVTSRSPDSTEAYVGITRQASRFNTVLPGAYVYYDFKTKALTLQGNADYSLTIPGMSWPINVNATVGGVIADKSDNYLYYGVGARVPYTYKRSVLSLGVNYASNNLRNAKRDMVYFTVGALFH